MVQHAVDDIQQEKDRNLSTKMIPVIIMSTRTSNMGSMKNLYEVYKSSLDEIQN